MMHFDDLLINHIGELGKFQILVILIVSIEQFSIGFQIMSPVFTAATPSHKCRLSEFLQNCTNNYKENTSASLDELGVCHFWAQNISTVDDNAFCENNFTEYSSRKECNSWIYDKSLYEKTMVTEWDLVCDRAWMTKPIASSYLAGMIFGNFIFGWLSDRYGRKLISFCSGIPNVIVGIILAFIPNYFAFVALRFVHGLFSAGKTSISFVIGTEYTGPSKRVHTGTYYMIMWALGYMTVAGICYFIRSWRTVMLVITIPEIVYFVLLYFFVPESPWWLYARNRREEADKIMKKIAKFNKVELPDDYTITNEKERVSASPLDLFKTPEIRRVTFVLIFIWAVNGFTYYGISLNSSAYHGNPYVNFVILGAVEIPAYIYISVTFTYFGRIVPFTLSMLLAGLPLLLMLAIPDAMSLGGTILVTVAKFFITATYTMLYVYTTEVYPTSIRSIGLCCHNIEARIFSSLAPFVPLVNVYHPDISTVLFGSVAVVGGLLVILMPETKNKPLVQTVAEGEVQIRESRLTLCGRQGKSDDTKPGIKTSIRYSLSVDNESENGSLRVGPEAGSDETEGMLPGLESVDIKNDIQKILVHL